MFNLERALKDGVNRIVHSTVSYSKDLSERFPYPLGEAARLGLDDWLQQIRMATSGVKFELIPQTLCAYRELEGAITATRDRSEVIKFKNEAITGLTAVQA